MIKDQFMLSNLNLKKYILSIAVLLSIVGFTGCKAPQKIAYFQDITEDTILMTNQGEIRIKPDDKLAIIVKTMEPQLSSLFNLEIISDRVGDQNVSLSGMSRYTVTPDGRIDIPVIGVVKVEGMTRSELSGFIKGELMGRNLAKDPVVTVDFSNFGVSVLGDVKNPGRYEINRDKITILEAISLAGDLDIAGKRDNIKVIREENGEARTYTVDLTNLRELSQSPAYYLSQGDVVYVEPNDMKKRQSTTNGNNLYSTGFWISVASLLTSVVTTIGVFVVK